MNSKEQVNSLINCLTNDEDLKQELWVHYLDGNPIESFSNHLAKLQLEYSEDIKLKKAIWNMVNNPPSNGTIIFLNNFTDFERNVICMLMLGLSLTEISKLKGISEVRIRQTVCAIRYNSAWSQYGI